MTYNNDKAEGVGERKKEENVGGEEGTGPFPGQVGKLEAKTGEFRVFRVQIAGEAVLDNL